VAADCSAAGLFTHRAFQFSMNRSHSESLEPAKVSISLQM
jgi:hypothetical protein